MTILLFLPELVQPHGGMARYFYVLLSSTKFDHANNNHALTILSVLLFAWQFYAVLRSIHGHQRIVYGPRIDLSQTCPRSFNFCAFNVCNVRKYRVYIFGIERLREALFAHALETSLVLRVVHPRTNRVIRIKIAAASNYDVCKHFSWPCNTTMPIEQASISMG